MKKLATILLFTLISGIFFIIGSLAGGVIAHRPGLFIGAFIGGPIGTYFAFRLAIMWRLTTPSHTGLIGAELGTLAAYLVAATHLDSPIICLLSPLLIGVGTLIGGKTRDNH